MLTFDAVDGGFNRQRISVTYSFDSCIFICKNTDNIITLLVEICFKEKRSIKNKVAAFVFCNDFIRFFRYIFVGYVVEGGKLFFVGKRRKM